MSEMSVERWRKIRADVQYLSELHAAAMASFEKIRAIWYRPDVQEALESLGSCDWGECFEVATSWRWDDKLRCWLPVCDEHSTEYVLAA